MSPRRSRLPGGVLLATAFVLAGCGSEPVAVPVSTTATPTSSSAPASSSAPVSTTATSRSSTAAATSTSAKPKVSDPLTGGRVSPGPVIAVKIDNTAPGRPQYGLSAADIVYVEQVEGGLTRLVAVFHSELPEQVGPVRSVRSTDVELLTTYGSPALVFSGGADGPMGMLAASSIVDASVFGSFYSRSPTARSPYNLHVNLAELATAVAHASEPRDIGFTFAEEYEFPADAAEATELTIVMQDGVTEFSYTDGRYQQVRFGEPVQDAGENPILADNVLVQNVTETPDGTVDVVGSPSYLSHTVGEGEFTLFRDGRAITGTWTREVEDGPTSFVGVDGEPVPLRPGKTWVLLAGSGSYVETAGSS